MIQDLELSDLRRFCRERGASEEHAGLILKSFYRDLSLTPWETDPVSFKLRASLKEASGGQVQGLPEIETERHSENDHSVKFLLRLSDGAAIESVLMPERTRLTLCVSSQVGCARQCVFCRTGQLGLQRNCGTGEITGQVWRANEWLSRHPSWLLERGFEPTTRVTNIVYMGMGEPLDNIDAVFRSLRILVEPHGLYLAQRRLSISTAGHADGILRLARELPGVNLALALHSTDEAKRQSIMPITKTWSLATLKNALREYLSSGGRGLLLQYLLAEGFNDSQDDAHQLIEWSRDLKAKVNLIPFNPVECDFPIPLRAPSSDSVQRFKDALHHAGLRVMLRISKGQDIGGACGQLAADNFVNNKKSRNLTRD